jgi:hypothetical protein
LFGSVLYRIVAPSTKSSSTNKTDADHGATRNTTTFAGLGRFDKMNQM